jgi:hypothetical protein
VGEKRKRAPFARLEMKRLFPSFLFHTSGQQKPVLAAAPDLPMEEIQRFEKEISVLGYQHVAELQSIEPEYKA